MTIVKGDWVRYAGDDDQDSFLYPREVVDVIDEYTIKLDDQTDIRYYGPEEVELCGVQPGERVWDISNPYVVGTVDSYGLGRMVYVHWDNGMASLVDEDTLMLTIGDNGVEVEIASVYSAHSELRVELMREDVRNVLLQYRTPRQADNRSHYTNLVVEPLDLAYLNNLDSAQTKVVKYTMRHKHKDGPNDIKKAIDVLNKILEYEYGEML